MINKKKNRNASWEKVLALYLFTLNMFLTTKRQLNLVKRNNLRYKMLIQPLFCARAFNNHWLDLNYSIIEALEQRRIQHPARHLPWSFLQKQLKQLTSFSGQHGRTHRSWESTCPPPLPSPVFRKSKIAQKIFFF